MTKEELEYTTRNLMKLLAEYYMISIEAYIGGSVPHVETLMDLDIMIKEANFTERQHEVLDRYYLKQMTQEETAESLGITQQTVLEHLGAIKKKVKAVAIKWGEKNDRI